MKSCVFILTLLIAANCFAAQRWTEPERAYSIIPPAGWKQSTQATDAGTIVKFTSSHARAEIGIGAVRHMPLLEPMPDWVLDMGFRKHRALIPMARVRGNGWDGLRREYFDSAESTRWVGVAAWHGSSVVVMTMKASPKEFQHWRPVFDTIVRSLRLAP